MKLSNADRGLVGLVLTTVAIGIIMREQISKTTLMEPKYSIGQKVKIKLAAVQHMSLRECAIDEYVGEIGEVTNYYWISPHHSEVFYIYIVRVGSSHKKITLHEDEIEACILSKPSKIRNHS